MVLTAASISPPPPPHLLGYEHLMRRVRQDMGTHSQQGCSGATVLAEVGKHLKLL